MNGKNQVVDIGTIKEVYSAFVADECRADTGFARRMQKDCKEALSDLIGAPVADDVDVSVVLNTPDLVHIAIPDHVCDIGDHEQISEAEMAEVAGGEIIVAGIISAIAAASVVAVIGGGVAAGLHWEQQTNGRN